MTVIREGPRVWTHCWAPGHSHCYCSSAQCPQNGLAPWASSHSKAGCTWTPNRVSGTLTTDLQELSSTRHIPSRPGPLFSDQESVFSPPRLFPCCYFCVCQLLSCIWLFGIPWTVVTRLLCPRDSPGKNSEVGSLSFLQGIFLTWGSNLGLLHWQVDSLPTEPPRKPPLLLTSLKS